MRKHRPFLTFLATAYLAGAGSAQAAVNTSQEMQRQILFESMLYGGQKAPNLQDKIPETLPASAPSSSPLPPQGTHATSSPVAEAEVHYLDAAPAPEKAATAVPAAPPAARPVRISGQQKTAVREPDYSAPVPTPEVRVASVQPAAAGSPPAHSAGEVYRRAKAGDVDAEYQLGMMYAQDRPGSPHADASSQSYYWFTQAASKGHPRAQYNLGVMYAQGEGIVQNLVEAYIWFNLSAAQRMEGALEARDMIAASLTPSALMKAQERSTLYHQKIAENLTRMQKEGAKAAIPIQ